MLSDSTLQITVKEGPLVKFWCDVKKNTHNYLFQAIKIFLPFHIYLCEARIASHTLTKQHLQQTEFGIREENPAVCF